MKATLLIGSLVALAAAQNSTNTTVGIGTQPAPLVQGNPRGVTFKADLQTSKPIQGFVIAGSTENGTGVMINANFYNLSQAAGAGPFMYHIHQFPVPSNGNCTATGGHLDPYLRLDSPPCDASNPQTCQVGDLSGKHGTVNSTTGAWSAYYRDQYLSTVNGSVAFFGNRSFVIHAANGTRLNCGNFTLLTGANSNFSAATSSAAATASTPVSVITSAPPASSGSAMVSASASGTMSASASGSGTPSSSASGSARPSATGTGDAASHRQNMVNTVAAGLLGMGFALAAFVL